MVEIKQEVSNEKDISGDGKKVSTVLSQVR